MSKQYRVVVPFGGHKAGDELGAYTAKNGDVWIYLKKRDDSYGVLLDCISDKVEEVKPKALRKWLVEEVATREESSVANGTRKMFLNPESMTMHGEFSGNAVETSVWVKITEQKEEERWVPKLRELYWLAIDGRASFDYWQGVGLEPHWLEQGLIFKTREECQAYIDSKKKAA